MALEAVLQSHSVFRLEQAMQALASLKESAALQGGGGFRG